jgi:hypothetical protein
MPEINKINQEKVEEPKAEDLAMKKFEQMKKIREKDLNRVNPESEFDDDEDLTNMDLTDLVLNEPIERIMRLKKIDSNKYFKIKMFMLPISQHDLIKYQSKAKNPKKTVTGKESLDLLFGHVFKRDGSLYTYEELQTFPRGWISDIGEELQKISGEDVEKNRELAIKLMSKE